MTTLTKAMFEFIFKNFVEYDHAIEGNELRVHHEDGHDSLYTIGHPEEGIPFEGTVVIRRQVKFIDGKVYFVNNCEAIFVGTEYGNNGDDINVVFHAYSSAN
jgi:hypothetical protein